MGTATGDRYYMKLMATQFQVLNYHNIDDSGWTPLARVTVYVGRNGAGENALLKALHKCNPAIEKPYNAQREFPRDRFMAKYRDGSDCPVCRVELEFSDDFRKELGERLNGAGIQRALNVFAKGVRRIEAPWQPEPARRIP